MKNIGIITARGGSKGIPKKNIKLFCGQPLIYYTIKAALNSNLDAVFVSTDCIEIAEISSKFGADVILRPDYLSLDETPTLEVLKHIEKSINLDFEIIMTLQPTSPFRTSEHINQALSYFHSIKEADSLVSVQEVPHSFHINKIMHYDNSFLKGNNEIQRRQLQKINYARNGAIYITKRSILNNGIFSGNTLPYFMDKISSIDIDDNDDWLIAESVKKNIDKINILKQPY